MSESEYLITVKTTITENGLIQTDTNFMGRIIREVLDTKNQHIHDSLIKLGWIPPSEN